MLIDIFSPYLPFITFFVSISVNIYLIFKRVSWYNLIFINIIIAIIFNALGIESYDLLSMLFSFIIDLFKSLFGAIGEALRGIFRIF